MERTSKLKMLFINLLIFLVLILLCNVVYASIKDTYEMKVNSALRINEIVSDGITGINITNNVVGAPDDLVEITIKDRVFYNKLKDILESVIQEDNNNQATDTWKIIVKKGDLDNIKELDLNGTGLANDSIKNITGIENFTNLEILHLNNNSISVSSLEKIKQLINLKELYLKNNGLESLPDLQVLTKLNKIDASGNGLRDLSGVYKVTNLKELYLSSNAITMTGLSDYLYYLHNIETLDLSGNSISGDLARARFPFSLKNLNLSENPSINKIETLTNLSNLESLSLNNDFNIEDLQIIGSTYYDELNEVDVPYLKNLKVLELQHVNGDYSTIDISSLTALKNLRELDLSKNNLTSIDGVAELYENLRVLYLNYNMITDLSPFVLYDYTDQGIMYIKQFVNLEHLEMKHNRDDETQTGLEKISEIRINEKLNLLRFIRKLYPLYCTTRIFNKFGT
jgi:Leucine-rich repeat (LRR) protein